ncbi:hypothetical protein L195_g042027 [Trifolium pratense]|uniref:Uncharacterized protein n=1 Tax=Trifolium pratense TaxID=57577 RepID=A0A2K3M5C6_TRIPR|nr:hypothetical protein L195_g042027 [Trifolium pratense]
MIHALKLEETALEATDAGVDENLSVDAGSDNEEEDSEVEDEGNDSSRQCICVLGLELFHWPHKLAFIAPELQTLQVILLVE